MRLCPKNVPLWSGDIWDILINLQNYLISLSKHSRQRYPFACNRNKACFDILFFTDWNSADLSHQAKYIRITPLLNNLAVGKS